MMDLPNYENAQKWGAFFKQLPKWQKVCFFGVIVVALMVMFYLYFGPWRHLNNENDKLKSDIAYMDRKKTELKDKKDELFQENLSLKTTLDPIRREAKDLYPELETKAALAKLVEDVKSIRSLATRGDYKPLETSRKIALIKKLKEIRAHYPTSPTITIFTQNGSSSRDHVANDLKDILIGAGFNAKFCGEAMIIDSGTFKNITVDFNPSNLKLVEQIHAAIVPDYIDQVFDGEVLDKTPKDNIKLRIEGNPIFSNSGVVTFQQ